MNHDNLGDLGGSLDQETGFEHLRSQRPDRDPNNPTASAATEKKLPDGIERRIAGGETAILTVVRQVRDDVRSLDRKISNHKKDTQEAIAEGISELVTAAFPKKDLLKHYNSHTASDAAEEDKKLLYRHIREKTVGGIVWAALGLLALAAWELLKARILSS